MVSVTEGPAGTRKMLKVSVIGYGSCLLPERGMVDVPGPPGPPGPPGLPGNLFSGKEHGQLLPG